MQTQMMKLEEDKSAEHAQINASASVSDVVSNVWLNKPVQMQECLGVMQYVRGENRPGTEFTLKSDLSFDSEAVEKNFESYQTGDDISNWKAKHLALIKRPKIDKKEVEGPIHSSVYKKIGEHILNDRKNADKNFKKGGKNTLLITDLQSVSPSDSKVTNKVSKWNKKRLVVGGDRDTVVMSDSHSSEISGDTTLTFIKANMHLGDLA